MDPTVQGGGEGRWQTGHRAARTDRTSASRHGTPDPRGARQIMDHIRHQLMRPQVYNAEAPGILAQLAKDRWQVPP